MAARPTVDLAPGRQNGYEALAEEIRAEAAARRGARPIVDLPCGEVGYIVRRTDECWRCAVATALQVAVNDVPDARLHERRRAGEDPAAIDRSAWQEFGHWLSDRGLRMLAHHKLPAARARWIGVVPSVAWARSHTMVMSFGDVYFDPSSDFEFAVLTRLHPSHLPSARRLRRRTWRPEHVAYGFSFQKLSRERR